MTSITGQATLVRLRRTLSSSGSSHPTLHSTCESRNVRTSPVGRSHGHHQALTPQAPHRLTVPQPHTLALPKISPGSRATAGGAGDPDGCLLTPSGARQPGLAPQDALLPATCEPPAPQLCSPEPLGRAVARCLLSTVSAEQFCSARCSAAHHVSSARAAKGSSCRCVAGLLLTFGNLRPRQPGPYQTVPLFEMQDLHFWEP